jgi:hypothetical protein
MPLTKPERKEKLQKLAESVAVHSYETPALQVHAAAGSGASCAALTAVGVW